jgi:RNA polymerase sigma-70 factor (ECF subfamily)
MNDHAHSDDLVGRAASGDPEAFRTLYEDFAPRLYRFALFRVRTPSDAEDLVQRVFVKMIEALPRYEERGLPFGAWVFRLARNAVIDFERTRRPQEPLDAVELQIGDGPGPDELAEVTFERERLLAAIADLTAEQQEVVTLRFFGGLGPGEIAALMGKREGSIRALQFRALESLRRMLAPEPDLAVEPAPVGADSTAGADAMPRPTRARPTRAFRTRDGSRVRPADDLVAAGSPFAGIALERAGLERFEP